MSLQKTVLFIVGPPAVGKMTVGAEIARRTGLRLFHNHHTIELVLQFFSFGSPPFGRLTGEMRRRVFEEVADSDLPGLIFTYVWAYSEPRDHEFVDELANIFRSRGGRALFVELESTLNVRLERNETPFRLAEKPSKRDLVESRARLLEIDAKYQLNSKGEFDGRADYVRINNNDLGPGEVADRVMAAFSLDAVNASEKK